jgi:murein DD-endopeptidase MepM/ murein hydrolase activator NlpD
MLRGMDTRRHAPIGRRRVQVTASAQRRMVPGYRRRSNRLHDLYTSDHLDIRQAGRFRWLFSTCLAAAVGMLAILVVLVGSMDQREAEGGLFSALARMGDAPLASLRLPSVRVDGLRWAIPKTDRLLIATGASVTKSVILDHIRQRRGNRDYMMNKPYARLAARLAPLAKADAQKVPPFNPFKLYANPDPLDGGDRREDGLQDASTKLVELLGGILPTEDGQELSNQEVLELVARHQAADDEATGLLPGSESGRVAGEILAGRSRAVSEVLPPNTTALPKTVFEAEDTGDDLEGREVRVVRAQKGDTLSRIVLRLGAEPWQARAITDAAKTIFTDNAMVPGQEVHVTLVPSVTRAGRVEPVRFSVFGEGHDHKVTIARDAAGEFVASASPIDERIIRAPIVDDDQPRASSLYASLHYTAERQGVPADVVLQILKIHAYETDFRQRVRAGDGFEFFFDVKEDDKAMEGGLGELLATSVTASGETHKFYRFRGPEGAVDYYDEQGNTSRKFLMRRPVRGEDVRITSGFGVRRHPILQIPKMHTGVDWACATGTPIMAAGNGVIEEAGRKGEYGNYIRIRHANGYKTAYGHMSRLAPGVSEGVKVRQGQIIGYVGTTGLSSGPHVHFEVLVNNSFVDPMSIQVPRERQLSGKQLADFQKERARIDDLMRRNPVSTRVAAQ